MGKKSTNEANLDLNHQFYSEPAPSANSKTTAEANMRLNARMNHGDGKPEEITPTYLVNETAAIKITGDND